MERELLKAGKLDTYITVYQLTRTQDSYGGYSKSRSSLKSLWAMVVPYKGKEKVEDETIVSTNKVGFLVRWDDDLNLDSSTVSPEQKYQVQYLSKYYEIDSVEYNCSFKDDGRLA